MFIFLSKFLTWKTLGNNTREIMKAFLSVIISVCKKHFKGEIDMRRKKFIVLYALFFFMSVFAMMNISHVLGAESDDVLPDSVQSERVSFGASFRISDFSETKYNKFTVVENIYYADDREGVSTGKHSAGDKIPMYEITFDDGSIHTAYCIEPGEDVNTGWKYTATEENIAVDAQWQNLKENYPKIAENIQIAAGCASSYIDDKEARAAAQIIIWELVSGMRDKDSGAVVDTYLRDCMDGAGRFDEFYEMFDKVINEYRKIPDCLKYVKADCESPYVMRFDEKTQCFYLTLEDSENPYFKYIDWNGLTGLSVEKLTDSGVVLKSDTYSPELTSCVGEKDTDLYYEEDDVFFVINAYGGSKRGQALVSGSMCPSVPVRFEFEYETVGILELYKNAQDGLFEGIKFTVTNTADSSDTYDAIIGSDAMAKLYLRPGDYVITEEVPDRYNEMAPEIVTIKPKEKTYILFLNTLRTYFNLEVNYYERETGERLEKPVSAELLAGSSYNLYDEVMLSIDGYVWDGYEGDEYKGENLSSDKKIDVYYVTESVPEVIPENTPEEVHPDTDDKFNGMIIPFMFSLLFAMPVLICRKRVCAQ